MTFAIRFQALDSLDGNAFGAYYIDVFDDSGNPVNGDNVIVQYQTVIDGVLGDILSQPIAGITKKIYNGLVQTGDGPFLNYALVGGPINPGPGPSAPTTPDLKIVSIIVGAKANSAGHNGKVTINATSSFGPIDYYIDDVLQTGFYNLTVDAGPHVAKVIDSTATEVSQPFNVEKVTSILSSDPSLTTGGKVSRWNAAFNPVVFTYARRDYEVTAIAQDDTTLKPKLTVSGNSTAAIKVGNYIYVDAGITNGISTYKGAFKALTILASNILVIDTAYVAPDTVSGFMNSNDLRPYYKIITQIKYVDPATGLFNTITSTNRPLTNGITRADISSFLQSILKPQPDLSGYTDVNYRDMGLSASYQISYAETWDGNTAIFNDVETPFYVIYAAKQIQEFGGGNLFDSVTQQGGLQLAKWLSDFKEPAYTPGFPCDLPFIYSEQIAGLDIYATIKGLDVNRVPLGTEATTTFLLNEDSTFLLQQDGYKFIIARANLVSTPIVEHVGLNRFLVNQEIAGAYYLKIQLFYDVDSVPVPITEPKIVRIDTVCPINPVYVRWIGLNGSWNYWRFNYNQVKTLDIQNPVIIKNYVFDWENAEGIESVVSKDASNKLQVFADALTQDDINGLQAIKFSPIVQILTNNNPIKWQTIVVNSSTFTEYETQNGEYEFSITFNMPSKNIQSQ